MLSIGHQIFTRESCDDSFSWAREIAEKVDDGAVLIARKLTQARGRGNRTWVVAEGQILHTLVLKPVPYQEFSETRLATLTMTLSLGLYEAFKKFGVTLKWPNDLCANGKKMGGMLMQSAWHEGLPKYIFVGYGINVNNLCSENPELSKIAISLREVTGTEHKLGELQMNLFSHLSHFYDRWKSGDDESLFVEWRKAQKCLGENITVHHKDESTAQGEVLDFHTNGDIVLETHDKQTIIVSYGQIEEIAF